MTSKQDFSWPSMGVFAQAVRAASHSGGVTDPRLSQNAPTEAEGTVEDGGFALSADYCQAVMDEITNPNSEISKEIDDFIRCNFGIEPSGDLVATSKLEKP